jgi:hypothetical protein
MASEFENTTADVQPLRTQLRELEGLADSFGRAMTRAFRQSVVDGRALEDVLRSLALSLSSRALNAALAPIGQGIGSLLTGGAGSIFRGVGAGGAAGGGPFSGNGVSSTRTSPGASRAGVSVVLNVTNPDAQSFRRAEAEVGAMLARAVARGQRGM